MRGFVLSAIVAMAVSPRGYAGSFGVDPVRLTLPSGARSTSLSLRNHASEPVVVQSEVMAWTQQDGKDVLTPSQDLIVSPPVFKVGPGATQLVRVGLRRAGEPDRELTYRLFLLEVPPPPAPGETGVTTRLRLGLPVFVTPRGNAAPVLDWRVRKGPHGEVELSLDNRGNAHVQAIDWKLTLHDGTPIAEENHFVYVLAGQRQSWIKTPKHRWSGEVLELAAQTSRGRVTAHLAPQ